MQFSRGIRVDFFDKEGNHASVLTAKRAVMEESRKDFEAIDSVLVVTNDGKTLKTSRLKWNSLKQRILSEQAFRMTTADKDTLYGIGFESDQTLANWTIRQASGTTGKAYTMAELEEAQEDELASRPAQTAVQDSSRNEQ